MLVIYNPMAGKQSITKRQRIIDTLTQGNAAFELYETTAVMDAYRKMQSLELDDYSCVVTVGGDGTIHEAVNGLLTRQDGRRIPLGFLPNGSGDDFCGNLGLDVGDV